MKRKFTVLKNISAVILAIVTVLLCIFAVKYTSGFKEVIDHSDSTPTTTIGTEVIY